MSISFEEFKKVELKTAKILSVERVEGSEKLLRLDIDLGNEKRQIVAGIGRKYTPELLAGKTIVVVANLEPKAVMGLESQGMLLAAHGEEGSPVLLVLDSDVPPGSAIS